MPSGDFLNNKQTNTTMISIERTKQLLSSLNLSDKEAEEIRDVASLLADVLFDDWNEKRKTSLNDKTK